MLHVDTSLIRGLAWVGLPCSNSDALPVKPSIQGLRKGDLAPRGWRGWATPGGAQIVSTTTYDGGISYSMVSRSPTRTHHAESFLETATSVLGKDHAERLCGTYGVSPSTSDPDALRRICLFESDVGFFAPALATAQADLIGKTYFVVFDLSNPFPGSISQDGTFATHAFDIVTLVGGVHEDRLPEEYKTVVSAWRDKILDFVVGGRAPWGEYIGGEKGERRGWVVDERGVREVGDGEWFDEDNGRSRKFFELAERVAGDKGV